MGPENGGSGRWRRLDEIFAAALDLAPSDRPGFLDRACGGDPELRSAVEALLRDADTAEDALGGAREALAEAARQAFSEPPEDLPPGRRVGAYRIVRMLGRGGMGSVYLADRADGAFEQRVALKVLRRGLDTDDLLARFRVERQILASLEHPNIARLLDGGSTEDGRPYLVMEHVEGEPLDVYCDRRRLTVEERLRLFGTVCEAVAHAHRNLVVHRDLKPSNVLVTEDGIPKLLDFGIAKLLSDEEAPEGGSLTRTGARLLSPLHASPEQVAGGAVTTATDVYGLGVLLYELLTGHNPHRFAGRASGDVEDAIVFHPPVPPARAVTEPAGARDRDGSGTVRTPDEIARDRGTRPAVLRRRLAGDLGSVVLKALRKEPDRRYASADRLAAELERCLSGQPVKAKRDSWRYRARKFVGRHTGAVAAVVLLVLSLAAGLAATTWQARRAAAAGDRARTEAAQAERVTEFLVELFEAPRADERSVGDTITAIAVLGRSAERLGELADQPELQARLLDVTGRVYVHLGQYDRARPLLEQALGIRRELLGGDSPEVAESLAALAWLHRSERDFARAEPLYREALAIRRRIHPDSSLQIAEAMGGLAQALRDLGRADTAVTLMREVVDRKRRALGPDDEETLRSESSLAYVLRARGDLDEAEDLYRKVFQQQRRAGSPPADLATTLNNLAYLQKTRGEPARAVETYQEALSHHRTAYGPGHPRSLMVMNNLAGALFETERVADAERVLREALAEARAAFPSDHWRVGASARAMGLVLSRQGRHDEAEPFLRETVEIYSAGLGPSHEWTTDARGLLGEGLAAQGRYEEAERQLLRSLEDLEGSAGERDRGTQTAARRLAELYEAWGREGEADRYRALASAN